MSLRRGIFASAALFNWVVGAGLTLAMPLFERLLGLEPVATSAKVYVDLFAVVVVAFGAAYLMLAIDFTQYRPFAALGAAAKRPWWRRCRVTTSPGTSVGRCWRCPAST
jgi:hypothetical protein